MCFKIALFSTSVFFAGLLAGHAQEGSLAATKNLQQIEENAGTPPALPEHIHRGSFWRGPSVSFGVGRFDDGIHGAGDSIQLSELSLNQRPIDSETVDAINAFLRENLDPYNLKLSENPIICSAYGESIGPDRLEPCEEIRLQFKASFRDWEKFTHPESGAYNSSGTCSIFITVRTRDVSWWCHGRDANPPEPILIEDYKRLGDD